MLIFKKLNGLIAYGIVGVTVTALDILLYTILAHWLYVPYLIANILAFVLANIYAFFANKLWVFRSTSFARNIVCPEAVEFFSARGVSCLINSGLLYVGVSLLLFSDILVKIFANIIIIILNYFFSKYIIFKNAKEQENTYD